jgi:hypothetical protein
MRAYLLATLAIVSACGGAPRRATTSNKAQVLRGIGRAVGCLDETKREELRARQVDVSVLAVPGACKGSTIFAFAVQADLLDSLASLPWIMQLDADQQGKAL